MYLDTIFPQVGGDGVAYNSQCGILILDNSLLLYQERSKTFDHPSTPGRTLGMPQ